MAVEIGALRALLSLDSAAFERGARRAEASMNSLQRRLSRVGRQFKSFGRTMSTRVTAPVVAATGLMVRSSLQTIDAQAKMAQSLDTSTSSLQVLARAAETAGVSQRDLEGSLRRMTRRISLAAQGTGAGAKAFERLGIAFEDLESLDAAERVALINDRIRELIPAAEQAGVASQVFGDRTGLAMLRLDVSQIDAARAALDRFGVTVTEVEADKIEEANDAISALGLVVKGLGNQLAVALAPTIQRIVERVADLAAWFNDLSPQMRRIIAASAGVAAAIGPLAVAVGFLATGLAALASPIGLAVLALGAAAGAAAAVWANWDTLSKKYPRTAAAMEAVAEAAKQMGLGQAERIREAFDAGARAIEAGTSVYDNLIQGEYKRALSGLKTLAKAMGDGAVANLDFMTLGGASALIDTIGQIGTTITQQVPVILAEGRRIPGKIGDGIVAGASALGDAITQIVTDLIEWIKGIPTRVAEAARQAGADIVQSIKNGLLGQDMSDVGKSFGKDLTSGMALGILAGKAPAEAEMRRVISDLENAARSEAETQSPSKKWMRIGRDLMSGLGVGIAANAQGAAQRAAEAATQVTDAAKDATDSGVREINSAFGQIGDALAGVIVRGQDFGAAMRNVFQQVASDFVSSGITNMLSGLFGGSAGGGSGLLGGLFGGLFGGFRADGGPVSANRAYVVGERGPEMFVPRNAGTIVPNGAMGAAAAPVVNITQEIYGTIRTEEEQMPDGQRIQRFFAADAVDEGNRMSLNNPRSALRAAGVKPRMRQT